MEVHRLTAQHRLNVETACFMYNVAHGLAPPTKVCAMFPIRVRERSAEGGMTDLNVPVVKTQADERFLV